MTTNLKNRILDAKYTRGISSWREIANLLEREFDEEFPELNARQRQEKIRAFIRYHEGKIGADNSDNNTVSTPEPTSNLASSVCPGPRSVEQKKDGSIIFEDIIEAIDGKTVTPEDVMLAHHLDIDKWEVLAYKSNIWNSQAKGGELLTLYQSKLTIKPRTVPFSRKDIDKWFSSKDFNSYKPLKPFKYDMSKEILEIDYTDLHVGLLSWASECGSNFDLKIIEDRFYESIGDIIERSRGRRFKLIRFVTIGDILHVDNSKQTTTNGTFQQIDGRVPKIFDLAVDMMTTALENLLQELKAPVEYVYVAGNHDRDTGYYLAKTIATAFKRDPNITFDIEPNPLKAKMYGKALVGYCHGDMPRQNLGTWLMQHYRKEFGESVYAEIHCGHLHSKSEDTMNGIKIMHLPALCESSYWEHQQGYKSERALVCTVWNEQKGKRENWITMF